jgi:Xaa-Pro aminopeptidase
MTSSTPYRDFPVQANVVLCVEPFVTLDGVSPFWDANGKFGLEDVVLVKDDGHEVMTSESIVSHDLFVVSSNGFRSKE